MIRVGSESQPRVTYYAEDIRPQRPDRRQFSLCSRVTNFFLRTFEVLATNTVSNRMCATGHLILGTVETFWGSYCLGVDDSGYYCTHTTLGVEVASNNMGRTALVGGIACFGASVAILLAHRVSKMQTQDRP